MASLVLKISVSLDGYVAPVYGSRPVPWLSRHPATWARFLRVVVVVFDLGGDAGDVQAQAADS